ncbi:MAG: serine hydrolase [Phycisphaerales bacterium]
MRESMRLMCWLMLVLVCVGCVQREHAAEDIAHDVCASRGGVGGFAAGHRFQFILTEVRGGKRVDSEFRADAEYFYPASTVKLVGAVAALHEMRELGAPLDRPILWYDVDDPGRALFASDGSVPRLDRELARMLIVSDNEAFNLCFDLAGPGAMNGLMWDAGFGSVRIEHRLSRTVKPPNRTAAGPVEVQTDHGAVRLERREGPAEWPAVSEETVGVGFMRGDTLVKEPMRFTHHNRISLRDLHELVIALSRPELTDRKLPIAEADRVMMQRLMGTLPRECRDPVFDPATFPDDWGKYFLSGVRRVAPDARIENKVGLAYGFLTDASRVVDPATGREFFLTATVYVNSDGVLNDDAYDYETVGLPLLADLGEAAAARVFGRGGEITSR